MPQNQKHTWNIWENRKPKSKRDVLKKKKEPNGNFGTKIKSSVKGLNSRMEKKTF